MDVVGICNLALGWVGQGAITSIDDASTTAELCKVNFDQVRDSVLEAKAWTFATSRFAVAEDGTAPAYGFGHRHLLPSTVLRVLEVDDGSGAWDLPWVLEGRYILDDVAGELKIRAIVRAEDPAEWTPTFCMAVAYRLASVLVLPLCENRALQTDMLQMYLKTLHEGGTLDGRQGTAEPQKVSGIRAARER